MGRCGVTVVFCCAYAVVAMNMRTAMASVFIIQITTHFACRPTPLRLPILEREPHCTGSGRTKANEKNCASFSSPDRGGVRRECSNERHAAHLRVDEQCSPYMQGRRGDRRHA